MSNVRTVHLRDFLAEEFMTLCGKSIPHLGSDERWVGFSHQVSKVSCRRCNMEKRKAQRFGVEAAKGHIYVCQACGKTGKSRDKVGDESCYMYSVLCYENTLTRNENGRVTGGTAVRTKGNAT